MSEKSKSIDLKKDFNKDERLKKVSKLKILLNRPELGALGGSILVFIFFGIVAVPGTFYLQGGELFDSFAIILGIIMGLMADCILIVNNIRDADNDIKTGKNTLTVIFGKKISKLQYSIFAIIPYLFPFWIFQNMVPKLAIFIVLFSFPICIRSIIDIWYKSGKSLNIVLENTARLQFIYSILLSFGFII